ncbi:MAG: 9-O-acetylesterase, partial [Planctomycetes bacterium]|nr:9-O-acetylesterase [Planctomycetota bacterium]
VKSVAMRELPPWPRDTANEPNRPAVLYNAMIAPLVPFPFRGVLWYQGESNRSRAEQYARLFPAMIRDWRAAFDRRLPFYFVQIAPYDYGDALGAVEVRWAQTKALELADTGMVVTLDIGEEHDIHPRNKQEVGRRLALHALSGCYGEDAVADGPAPVALQRVGQALRVRFDQPIAEVPGADGASGEPLLAGFELAGADGVFAAATARLSNGAVLVESDTVPEPLHVRYAWSPVPPVSLRNLGGLPAGPFRLSLPH